ncbi:hypothetical protein [Pseudotamlana agarivorans]|nr:hypothetical protein [Tamlana agarivorans]
MKNLIRLGLIIVLIYFVSQILSPDFDLFKSGTKTSISKSGDK